MVRIQLENGYLDVKEGTDFPLNYSIGDIRDIQKRSGSFSKTITLLGTKNNNKLLNNYYDVNIQAGTFDVDKITECQVLQNGLPILVNGALQLLEVVKYQKTDSHDEYVEYKVQVKDRVSDFYTQIANKELTDIDLTEFNHTYNATNVKNSFTNDVTDGYKYLLPYDNDNFYWLTAFHPAIYAKVYFDKIFEGAGYTYEWGNLNPTSGTATDNNYFEKLVIPYSGKIPTVDYSVNAVEANQTKDYKFATEGGYLSVTNSYRNLITWTETLDDNNNFNPTTGIFTVPQVVTPPDSYQFELTVDVDIIIKNNEAGTIYAYKDGTFGSTDYGMIIRARNNDSYNVGLVSKNDVGSIAYNDTFSTGETSIGNYTGVFNMPVTNVVSGDEISLGVFATQQTLFEFVKLYTDTSYTTFADFDIYVRFNSIELRVVPPSVFSSGATLDINQYRPKKVKQSDFIKSLFQMYNIFPEVDKSQPNKLILRQRDEYYDSGETVDWSKKLMKEREQSVRFLPELSAKKTVLTYKQDKDEPNETYLNATKEVYGQLEYTYRNEYTKGEDKKELIFSPTPIIETPFGAIVPTFGYVPEVNIRILVDGGTQTCADSFNIYDYAIGSSFSGEAYILNAPLLTHFDDPINPTFDINFGTCDYYFYNNWNSKTNNNLYNLYWRRTLKQIDNGKLFTAYFDLNEADIQSLKLNHKIRIDNSYWNINKVIDYNANNKQATKVELISIDSDLIIGKFAEGSTSPVKPVKPVKPIKPTKPLIPIGSIITKNRRAKNALMPEQELIVCGLNNKVSPNVKCGMVIGENLEVNEAGVYVPVISGTTFIYNPDGTYIDGSGLVGSPYNLVEAEVDSVLDPFSLSVANFVDGGTDEVLGLGSVVSVNTLDGGLDSVL